MSACYASIENNLVPSAIRESVKYSSLPGMISFAGGSPDPATFPVQELAEITARVLNEQGGSALNYSESEGVPALRELIVSQMQKDGIADIGVENILVTNGSQQGLDFCGKLFIDSGDIIICENPSYLGALNAFAVYGAQFIGVPSDNDGMIMEDLEKTLKENPKVKLIYTVASFQNPSGKSLSQERRQKMLALAQEHGALIVEDDPYGSLYFGEKRDVTIKHYDNSDNVIYLGTYSKTFCPGLRIGWIAADKEIIQKFTIIKQSTDLHTSTLAQMQLYEYVRSIDWDAHTADLRKFYHEKWNVMLAELKRCFPEVINYTIPTGGLFTWVDLPENIKAEDVLMTAVAHKVIFVPGAPFFIGRKEHNHLRLCFGTSSKVEICEGIGRLGSVLKEYCAQTN